MTWAFGKVILLGEHAVVYGHPALAGALERGVRARADVRDRDGPTTLCVPAWELRVQSDDDHPVAEALRALLAELLPGPLSLDIRADADLPAAAGLGSSAALSVSLARAIAAGTGRALADDDVERIADLAERCFHENPSGIDVALAARGGLGVFRRGEGLRQLDAAPLRLLVGLSGQVRRTADMVARVRAALGARRKDTASRLALLGEAAEAGAAALARADHAALGDLMSRAHETLAALGVSSPVLEELVSAAHRAGAEGAKLTGAGGGGAVLALAPDREEAVLEAWRALGYDGFACFAGARREERREDGTEA